jgi:pilus assembly protein CpaE
MATVLLIEDEVIFHRMLEHALRPLGHTVFKEFSGTAGLVAAKMVKPDVIITDLNLPDISGYEVTKRLRNDPEFATIPIIVLTSQTNLQDKLSSFEYGADDHINKPFEPAELIARMNVLIRRAEMVKAVKSAGSRPEPEKVARMIAVHSLRGGIGTSTLAVNLALGLTGLWEKPTMLLDLVMNAGQVALMLNHPLKRTWADMGNMNAADIDPGLLHTIIEKHNSGLDFISSPVYPSEAETITEEIMGISLKFLRTSYDYMVADLPHDFSELSLQVLDVADIVLMVIAPELPSVRAAAAALDTYNKLGYLPDKIKMVMNNTFPRNGLPHDRIEKVLNKKITTTFPFTPDSLVQSINLGRPILYRAPDEPISQLIEDLAFYLSEDRHKKTQPDKPTQSWKRVYYRFMKGRKDKLV